MSRASLGPVLILSPRFSCAPSAAPGDRDWVCMIYIFWHWEVAGRASAFHPLEALLPESPLSLRFRDIFCFLFPHLYPPPCFF